MACNRFAGQLGLNLLAKFSAAYIRREWIHLFTYRIVDAFSLTIINYAHEGGKAIQGARKSGVGVKMNLNFLDLLMLRPAFKPASMAFLRCSKSPFAVKAAIGMIPRCFAVITFMFATAFSFR